MPERTFDRWLWGLVAAFVIVLAVNGVMVWVALDQADPVVGSYLNGPR